MKHKMLYILLTEKMNQVFHFYPFPCMPRPKLVFPSVHPALLGDAGGRIPLSLASETKCQPAPIHVYLLLVMSEVAQK